MNPDVATPTLSSTTPVDTPISPQGQVQLMDMAYSRLRSGIFVLPLVSGVFTAAYAQSNDASIMVRWFFVYCIFAATQLYIYRRHYLPALRSLAPEHMLQRWIPRFYVLAFIHGCGLSLPVLIMGKGVEFELLILWMLTLAAILAGNATHQTPMLRIFWCFFIPSWHLSILFVCITQPRLWQYLVLLSLIYTIVIVRHALIANRFFVKQIRLQEHSEYLAVQFRQAKEEAEQALQAKNQFLTTASHDLRQPVHAMGMLVEAISRKNDSAQLLPLINDLRSSIRSVNLMFNSLLDLSRIESQNTKARTEPVDLSALIQDIATIFKEEAHSHGLQWRQHLPSQTVIVWTDASLLRQALSNLVHNALRYTVKGGVLIGLRQRAGQWQVEVWDTGMGVADNEHERIFSPYFRSENAWNNDRSGYGLGLDVVARCASLIGATYGLNSRIGRGTRFWLRLPQSTSIVHPPKATAPLPHQALEPPADPLNHSVTFTPLKGRLLVVEDDPLLINAMQALLSDWGVEARFATQAQQAFAALDEGFEPQAILCDQRLRSGESGFEILRDLLERCPQASGAMCSGEHRSPALLQAENEGYVVLHKPVDVGQLRALLERWFVRGAAQA
jgi:signal transduction histidine kinase/CheY-like chemotaxis protein